MRNVINSFLCDEQATLLVTEWIVLVTILVIAVLPAVLVTRSRKAAEPVPLAIGQGR